MYPSHDRPVYPRMFPIRLICLILLLASGCALFPPSPTPTPTATPTPLPSPTPWPTPSPYPSPWPTSTPEPPDTGWQPLRPGAELRQIRVHPTHEENDGVDVAERLTIVRLDPNVVRFRVHYDPITPLMVAEWAERLGSPLVINGGYFTPENETVGLLVSEGQVWGASYGDYAGMFIVHTEGEAERVEMRWLREQPYDPDEPLKEALQSFPVLVKPGGVMGFPADADDGRPARRTVVAQDRLGRILLIAAPRGSLGLHELACFLAASDLDLDIALNLDGGFSTGLWLETDQKADQNPSVKIDSAVQVPSVISVDFR
jgi:uncharacterized protein YigE (DUF2233 family)